MDASKIRNVAILGHQSSGKTTLVESIYATALGKPKGSIEKGSTISDYLPEEKARLEMLLSWVTKVVEKLLWLNQFMQLL